MSTPQDGEVARAEKLDVSGTFKAESGAKTSRVETIGSAEQGIKFDESDRLLFARQILFFSS